MVTVLMEAPGDYAPVDRGAFASVRQFVLVVDRPPAPAQLRRLGGAGPVRWDPGSAAVGIRFEWPAGALAEGIVAAVRRVEATGLRAVRVDTRDWVTLGDIARRVGRSRETVRLWALGRLGPGRFPPPLNPGRDTSFFSWAEVLTWLRERLGLALPEEEPVLVAANLALQLRALAPRVRRIETLCELLGVRGSGLDAAPTAVGDDDVVEEA
ncbi:MAG TPA: hypothetical protein VNV66_09510 [Pilimelia sp.]|nr:hypothetical protein [Pilimelia sp.]